MILIPGIVHGQFNERYLILYQPLRGVLHRSDRAIETMYDIKSRGDTSMQPNF